MSLLRVMDFVEENAPTTAAAGGAAAAGGIAMSPSLPMTASSGTPPGKYRGPPLTQFSLTQFQHTQFFINLTRGIYFILYNGF